MHRLSRFALPAAAVAVLGLGGSAVAVAHTDQHHGHAKKAHAAKGTIVVTEHATTDTTTDTGATGDSVGDVLTFANDVFDSADQTKVATDQGYCVRVVVGASYECNWTTFLPGGQLVVEGPFSDTTDTTLAITGGTGIYRRARGTMDLHALDGGAKYTFTFHVSR